MNVETSSIHLFVASHGRRGGRAQNNFAAASDPVFVSVTVQDENTRSVRRDCGQNVWAVDQCEPDAIAQAYG